MGSFTEAFYPHWLETRRRIFDSSHHASKTPATPVELMILEPLVHARTS